MSDSNRKNEEEVSKLQDDPTKAVKTPSTQAKNSQEEQSLKTNDQHPLKNAFMLGGKINPSIKNPSTPTQPVNEVLKTNPPVSVASVSDAPKSDPPVLEAPVSDGPKNVLPVSETPVSEAPKTILPVPAQPDPNTETKKRGKVTVSTCDCPPSPPTQPLPPPPPPPPPPQPPKVEEKEEPEKEDKIPETKNEEECMNACVKPVPEPCPTCKKREDEQQQKQDKDKEPHADQKESLESKCISQCKNINLLPGKTDSHDFLCSQHNARHQKDLQDTAKCNACTQTDSAQKELMNKECCEKQRETAKLSKTKHDIARQNYENASEAAQKAREEQIQKEIIQYQDTLKREKNERAVQVKKSKEELDKKEAEQKEMRQKIYARAQAMAEEEKKANEKKLALKKRREEEWAKRLQKGQLMQEKTEQNTKLVITKQLVAKSGERTQQSTTAEGSKEMDTNQENTGQPPQAANGSKKIVKQPSPTASKENS